MKKIEIEIVEQIVAPTQTRKVKDLPFILQERESKNWKPVKIINAGMKR